MLVAAAKGYLIELKAHASRRFRSHGGTPVTLCKPVATTLIVCMRVKSIVAREWPTGESFLECDGFELPLCSVRGPETRFGGEVKRRELAVLWVHQVEVVSAEMRSKQMSSLTLSAESASDEYIEDKDREHNPSRNTCKPLDRVQ